MDYLNIEYASYYGIPIVNYAMIGVTIVVLAAATLMEGNKNNTFFSETVAMSPEQMSPSKTVSETVSSSLNTLKSLTSPLTESLPVAVPVSESSSSSGLSDISKTISNVGEQVKESIKEISSSPEKQKGGKKRKTKGKRDAPHKKSIKHR